MPQGHEWAAYIALECRGLVEMVAPSGTYLLRPTHQGTAALAAARARDALEAEAIQAATDMVRIAGDLDAAATSRVASGVRRDAQACADQLRKAGMRLKAALDAEMSAITEARQAGL